MLKMMLLATALTLSVGPYLAQAQADRPLRIGCVDIKRIFDNYHRTHQLEEQINTELEVRKRELQQLADDVTQLRSQLRLMEPGATRSRREKELVIKQQLFEFHGNWLRDELRVRMMSHLLQIAREIFIAIQRYGEEQGYDLILQLHSDEFSATSEDELKLKIRERHVLYANRSLDLTATILAKLNQQQPSKEQPR
jgi:Skp family chaperone for outer membrane proteins